MKVEVKRTELTREVISAIDAANQRTVLELGIKMSNYAKALSPVDQGQLRNSISVATSETTGINLNTQPGEKAPPLDNAGLKKGEVYVGSNVEHAVYMEYGTKRVHARPFLAPAKEIVINGRNAWEVAKEYNDKEMDMRGIRD